MKPVYLPNESVRSSLVRLWSNGTHGERSWSTEIVSKSIKSEFPYAHKLQPLPHGRIAINDRLRFLSLIIRLDEHSKKLRLFKRASRFAHPVLHEGTRVKSDFSDTNLIKSLLVHSELSDIQVAHCFIAMSSLGMLTEGLSC